MLDKSRQWQYNTKAQIICLQYCHLRFSHVFTGYVSKRMVVIWRSRKKQAVSSNSDTNHAGTSYFCQVPPATVLSTAEARSATHTRFHAVGSFLMISEYLWWLQRFQLQRVTKGLPSSTRVTECCGLSEPCESMVSSQVQRRLRRPGSRFYWGWAVVLGDEKGIPGRIVYFLTGKVDLKFDNLGITRKLKKWDVCTVCRKEIKMNLRNQCFSSALATPQALSREIEQIKQVMAFAETTPGPWARRRAVGGWLFFNVP